MLARRPSSARAIIQFALPGLAAVALLGFVAVAVLRHTGTEQAIRSAKEVTRLAGEGIVAPAIGFDVLDRRPGALARLDRIVRHRVIRDPIVRVKLWDAAGRILYSDDRRLIGRRFPLPAEERDALEHGGVAAEVSDLTRPENLYEHHYGKLLEVYQGIRARDGRRLLFEAYHRFSSVSASGRRVWLAFLPALIGALVLLELVQIPLAASLVRRLRRGQEEREGLLQRSVEASQLERRRIARDLHDGPVQNLAGVSFSLAAAEQRLRADGHDADAAHAVGDAAAGTRESIRALRTLLVDLYPPSLHQAGLAAAVDDLLAPLRAAGLEASADVATGLDLPPATEAVLFRVAQEGLRNVLVHSGARHAAVRAAREDGRVRLEVRDDGRGFAPGDQPGRAAGHFGLGMLDDLARDAGGELSVRSHPGGGTAVAVEVPVP